MTSIVPVGHRGEYQATGFRHPVPDDAALALDGLLHPRWMAGTLLPTLRTRGIPRPFRNLYEEIGHCGVTKIRPRFRGEHDRMSGRPVMAARNRCARRLILKASCIRRMPWALRIGNGTPSCIEPLAGRQPSNTPSRRSRPSKNPWSARQFATESWSSSMAGGHAAATHVLMALALGARFVFAGAPSSTAPPCRTARLSITSSTSFRRELLTELWPC